MFQMTVKDVIKIGNNISIGGACENKINYTSKLIDDTGNEYDTYIPLGKDLVFDENIITVCLQGDYDANTFKGKVLRSVSA
ncbi:MAG: hypothetical protein FWF94_08675 [Oscillospiraceae bacterium]|nr:hypothetical protein [Oscillospiraceae bacterium]